MSGFAIAPILSIEEGAFSASTAWLARLLWLFSYLRVVTVDRRLRRLTVVTTRLWFWRRERVIDFDQISRIIYQGQQMPTLMFWRYLPLSDSGGAAAAFFLISLALKGSSDELTLFVIWEDQPRERDWLDQLAGTPRARVAIGDEAAVHVVDLLHEYLGVPIARH